MIKLIYCIYRKPTLSREAFQTYWKTNHAALMRKHAATLGATRYVQSHAVESPVAHSHNKVRGSEVELYDGLTEIWWEDEAAMTSGGGDPAALQATAKALLQDEAEFIDLKRSVIFFATEIEVFATA